MYAHCQILTVEKVQTTRPKSGEDELKAIIQDACRIEKNLQVESGMVIVQDPPGPLHWENTYFTLITEDDTIATPPNTSAESAVQPLRNNPGSIIDLTASDDELSPTRRISSKPEVIVKQEITDDDIIAKVAGKGKGVARPLKDGVAGRGNLKVATKSYRHGDGNEVEKMTKAETILANIADGLSPQAQERREVSRMNLLRETMDQEHKDRVVDERIRELKLEIRTLKKEIDDLRREGTHQRDRATEAMAVLSVLKSTNHLVTSIHNPPATSIAAMSSFPTDLPFYSVPLTGHRSPEPEVVAGPSHQAMDFHQQDSDGDGSKILDEE